MKLKNLIILAIIFVILGGYVYFVEIKQHAEEEKIEAAAQQLFHFKKDSVQALIIRNRNGDFRLEKAQDEWKITRPLETGADQSAVNGLLNSLENAKKEKEFAVLPGELPDYGLASRAVAVQVILKNGSTDSVRFGDKTPVGSNVFTSSTDTMVYTVPQSLKTGFEKKLFDLRNKNLLQFKQNMVRRIVIDNRHGQIEIEQNGAGKWQLTKIDRPADNGTISGLLSRLANNRVKAFVDESGKKLRQYGLSRPAYQVNLFLGPEQGKKLLLISREIDGTFYAKDDSRKPIFEIDSALVKELGKNLNGYRDDDFASFDKNNVDRLVIQYGDTLIGAVKDSAGDWYTDDQARQKLKKTEIMKFFSDIDFVSIDSFVKDGSYNPSKYGLANPSLQVSLFSGEQPELIAKFGAEKGDEVYAANNLYESVYLLPRSRVQKFKLKLPDLLESPAAVPDTSGN